MRQPRIELYRGADGLHYWRLRALNGRIVADGSEGYARHAGAFKAAKRAVLLMVASLIVDVAA